MYLKIIYVFLLTCIYTSCTSCQYVALESVNYQCLFNPNYKKSLLFQLRHTQSNKEIENILSILQFIPGKKDIYSIVKSKINLEDKNISLGLIYSFIYCLAFEEDDASFKFLITLLKNDFYYGYALDTEVDTVIYLREYQRRISRNISGQVELIGSTPFTETNTLILKEILSSRYPYISSFKKLFIKEKNNFYKWTSTGWIKKDEMYGASNFIDFDSATFSKNNQYVCIKAGKSGGISRDRAFILKKTKQGWKVIQVL